MFCVIYRSSKRSTYLHVEKHILSRVPEALLMKGFGQPQLAMMLPLMDVKLVNAELEKVKQALSEQGYYLQLPPPPEDIETTSFFGGDKIRRAR